MFAANGRLPVHATMILIYSVKLYDCTFLGTAVSGVAVSATSGCTSNGRFTLNTNQALRKHNCFEMAASGSGIPAKPKCRFHTRHKSCCDQAAMARTFLETLVSGRRVSEATRRRCPVHRWTRSITADAGDRFFGDYGLRDKSICRALIRAPLITKAGAIRQAGTGDNSETTVSGRRVSEATRRRCPVHRWARSITADAGDRFFGDCGLRDKSICRALIRASLITKAGAIRQASTGDNSETTVSGRRVSEAARRRCSVHSWARSITADAGDRFFGDDGLRDKSICRALIRAPLITKAGAIWPAGTGDNSETTVSGRRVSEATRRRCSVHRWARSITADAGDRFFGDCGLRDKSICRALIRAPLITKAGAIWPAGTGDNSETTVSGRRVSEATKRRCSVHRWARSITANAGDRFFGDCGLRETCNCFVSTRQAHGLS
jgi:hypothetical protein